MSSAQLDTLPAVEEEPTPAAPAGNRLRLEAAERLAAHRLRRSGRHGHGSAIHDGDTGRRPEGRNRIAAAVAERYAASPSYRAVLAAEAERAIQQATAAAEVAARSAAAVQTAQKELLAELKKWTAPQQFSPETAAVLDRETEVELAPRGPQPVVAGKSEPKARPAKIPAPANAPEAPTKELSSAGLTVRLYEDLPRPAIEPVRRTTAADPVASHAAAMDEAQVLDELEEEIAFRQSPVFETLEAFEHTTEPIAANLLEFPRQLVAAKKARPRLAEGPLREESPRNPQLRIFEVEPEQISSVPAPSAAPEWSSIFLDAHSVTAPETEPESAILPSLLPPRTAPLGLRLMAAAVDGVLILGAFVAFATLAAYLADEAPSGPVAGMIAAATLVFFALLYQALFFSLSDQTPGMRYARIGLCTFTDENPSRAAMRRRIWAQAVAVLPLGLGLLWVWLDDDRLGWHDRISRMYQRAY